MHYKREATGGLGDEYFIAKMETEPSSRFKIWITRSVDFTGTGSDNGFRAALYGSTADDLVNAYYVECE